MQSHLCVKKESPRGERFWPHFLLWYGALHIFYSKEEWETKHVLLPSAKVRVVNRDSSSYYCVVGTYTHTSSKNSQSRFLDVMPFTLLEELNFNPFPAHGTKVARQRGNYSRRRWTNDIYQEISNICPSLGNERRKCVCRKRESRDFLVLGRSFFWELLLCSIKVTNLKLILDCPLTFGLNSQA